MLWLIPEPLYHAVVHDLLGRLVEPIGDRSPMADRSPIVLRDDQSDGDQFARAKADTFNPSFGRPRRRLVQIRLLPAC